MPFDVERYAAGLRRANDREAVRIREMADLARADAHRIADLIGRADHTVRTIYLFGSLTGSGPRHLRFDIDLAIDGGDVFAAEEIAESSAFPVDIVALDLLPPATRDRIKQTGDLVYTTE